MFNTEVVGRLAGIISFCAFIPYIISTLRGKTIPNRATWLIWAVVGYMIASSYYASGARQTMWIPISYIIGPCIIFLLSIKYGEGGWTGLEKFCLLGAGISVPLWYIFNSSLTALIINIFMDLAGALPTIKKAYKKPESEDKAAWAMATTGSAVNLLAIENWAFAIYIYPIYMFLAIGLITSLIFLRQGQTQKVT